MTTAGTAAVAVADGAAMTTDGAAGASRPPRRPSKPPAGWVFGAALGAFFAALALLAFQVRTGEDPALGQPTAQTQPAQPRRVLIRRVIERVVVHHPAESSAGAAPVAPAPATTSSAPAPPPSRRRPRRPLPLPPR